MNINSKIALMKRWGKIIFGKNLVAINQGIGKVYSIDRLEGYYNDLTGKVSNKAILDSNGIPINKVSNGNYVYFPITIFQYSLGLWDNYLLYREESYIKSFTILAEWIINNQREDGSWDCFSPIGHSKYTVSSMGQGEAVSVLLRMYKFSGNKKYLMAAKKAVEFMINEVKDGGTLIIEGNNFIFEEYPNENEKRSSVLNGWIFSLFGIYDYLKIVDDNCVRQIFNNSIRSLSESLYRYDTGYWTFYDQSGRIASPAYHNLHIALLKVLGEITNDKNIIEYTKKFESYSTKKIYKIRAILRKVIQKLFEKSEGVIIE